MVRCAGRDSRPAARLTYFSHLIMVDSKPSMRDCKEVRTRRASRPFPRGTVGGGCAMQWANAGRREASARAAHADAGGACRVSVGEAARRYERREGHSPGEASGPKGFSGLRGERGGGKPSRQVASAAPRGSCQVPQDGGACRNYPEDRSRSGEAAANRRGSGPPATRPAGCASTGSVRSRVSNARTVPEIRPAIRDRHKCLWDNKLNSSAAASRPGGRIGTACKNDKPCVKSAPDKGKHL